MKRVLIIFRARMLASALGCNASHRLRALIGPEAASRERRLSSVERYLVSPDAEPGPPPLMALCLEPKVIHKGKATSRKPPRRFPRAAGRMLQPSAVPHP